MDLNNLAQFLIKAKLNTYAKNGGGKETVLPDGRKQFEFSDADFRYLDIYSGFNSFAGQEVVFYQGRPIWEMNYQGEILNQLDQDVNVKEVYQFLKKALRQVKLDKPFRGPDRFADGGFKYINKVEGNIKKLQGTEMIYLNEKKIYQLRYFGGVAE